MKKRPRVAVLNTVEAGANKHIIVDTYQWGVVKTSAGKELLLGMFRPGYVKSVESFNPVAENRQVVVLGASTTKETIAANTRYKIEIGNPDDKYETEKRWPVIHAYTTPSVLGGTAAEERLNVYTALKNKVNAYAGNNATAYLLHSFAFTLGGAVGNKVLAVGDTMTQTTSGATAVVGKISVTSGSFAAGTAAGTVWVYNELVAAILATPAKTWTFQTDETLTQTDVTLVLATGLAIVDDAGYFVSSIARNGANWYGATDGFATDVFEVAEAPVYAEGIGSVMAALVPRYDVSRQDAITGRLEFELQNGDAFDITKTYRKYVITMADGDENALSGEKEAANQEVILYVDYAAGELAQITTDLATLL